MTTNGTINRRQLSSQQWLVRGRSRRRTVAGRSRKLQGSTGGIGTLIVTRPAIHCRLSQATKIRVCQFITANPGRKSRVIASSLGLDKRELNRFLSYEGKQSWGLFVVNWRWYASGDIQIPIPLDGGPQDPAMTPLTVCGVLAGMPELEAIRQIRRLDRVGVEKAFSEAEYSSLQDALKIELVQRLEQLKREAVTSQPARAALHPFVSLALLVVGVAMLVRLLLMLLK